MQAIDETALGDFIRDGSARIARLAVPTIKDGVPAAFRSTAASVARQASGRWNVVKTPGTAFATDVSMRTLRVGEGFASQCKRVMEVITGSINPELIAILRSLGDIVVAKKAVMAAFFHYFVAHEFVHIEQGLGSDQYRDSDFYMPIVMEADYVADVAGLVIALEAGIPELATLDRYQSAVLLMSIHIAAMHGFVPSRRADPRPRSWLAATFQRSTALDSETFSRLLVWYLHFARVTKAGICPTFESPAFIRSWIVMLPRLVASDRAITLESVEARRRKPYEAGSDVVLAYHGEDGLYRIHRAGFTDVDRTQRLAVAILQEEFDAVRAELEELLVFNPALIPTETRRNVDVEWLTAGLIERLDAGREAISRNDLASVSASTREIRRDFDRLKVSLRDRAERDPMLDDLFERGENIFVEITSRLAEPTLDGPVVSGLLLRLVSLVDQIAVYFA